MLIAVVLTLRRVCAAPGCAVGSEAALEAVGDDVIPGVSLTNLDRLSISEEIKSIPLSLA